MIKDGKIFGKINVFDFLVIFLIIALVLGIAYKVTALKAKQNSSQCELTYELFIKGVRQETMDTFKIDQLIYDKSTKEPIGKIVSISAKEATEIMETYDGKVIEAPIEDRLDATLTIQTTAQKNNLGTPMIKQVKLLDGMDLTFETKFIRCIGELRNIAFIDENK